MIDLVNFLTEGSPTLPTLAHLLTPSQLSVGEHGKTFSSYFDLPTQSGNHKAIFCSAEVPHSNLALAHGSRDHAAS